MPVSKRKRPASPEGEDWEDASSSSSGSEQDTYDISSALVGKRPKITQHAEDDDDDLAAFIQNSIAKRAVKEGTQVVKNAKGKSKMSKGEVGGGSFQSMGEFLLLLDGVVLMPMIRSPSIFAAIPNASGLSDTNTYSEIIYTYPTGQSS